MKILYFAWKDSETGMNTIAFGTEEEILDDCLTGEDLDWDDISDLKDFFDDEGDLCEDYLISTQSSLNDIDEKLLSLGYVKDARLKNCGWG